MPNFNENNSYTPLFKEPADPLISEEAERITARLNNIKKALEEAENMLKNEKLSPEDRSMLEVAARVCRLQLEQTQTRFQNAAAQL